MSCGICERNKAKYIVIFEFNFIEQEIEICEKCKKVLELDRYDKYRKIEEKQR